MTDQANTTQTGQQSSSQQGQSQSSGQDSGAGSPNTPTTASRPDYVPEQFWDAASNAVKPEFTTHIGELAALKAQTDARLAALPKDAAGYKIEPPKDYKVPDGFVVDETHPLAAPLRAIAHKHQLSQDAVSELVQAQAEARAAETKTYNDAVAAETAKLGANATARVTAARTWLAGMLGDKAATDLLGNDKTPGLLIFSAAGVEYLEKLQAAFATQGGAPLNGKGREPPAAPKPDIAQRLYGATTPQQRAN